MTNERADSITCLKMVEHVCVRDALSPDLPPCRCISSERSLLQCNRYGKARFGSAVLRSVKSCRL
jgi:hypothetical protein